MNGSSGSTASEHGMGIWNWGRRHCLMPMTHAPETGARKLASVSGAGFSRQLLNFWRQKPIHTNKK